MKHYKRPYFYTGLGLLLAEIAKQIILTIENGAYQWYYFPFQLCSIPMYVGLLIGLIKNDKICRTLMTFMQDYCLLCGVMAFMDTSGMIYENPVLTAHSFLWHMALICIGFTAGVSRFTKRRLRDFLNCSLVFLIGCMIASILNRCLNSLGTINLFYINTRYKMAQIVFDGIAEKIGNTLTIHLYMFCIFFGASIVHLLFYIANKEHLKRHLYRKA